MGKTFLGRRDWTIKKFPGMPLKVKWLLGAVRKAYELIYGYRTLLVFPKPYIDGWNSETNCSRINIWLETRWEIFESLSTTFFCHIHIQTQISSKICKDYRVNLTLSIRRGPKLNVSIFKPYKAKNSGRIFSLLSFNSFLDISR